MVISIANPSNHQHIDGRCQLSFSVTLFDFSTDIPINDFFKKKTIHFLEKALGISFLVYVNPTK
jgi:hypothetical protein